jgi:uncharacterized protein YdaU (DUF1376 family)
MAGNPWHRRYHSDALAGMLSLTLEERGAYQTVLDLIYDRSGPIADNERLLSGYMGCSIRKGKLVAADGFLTNPRAEKQLENDAKTARKLAENGAKGGRKKAENAKNGNENNNSGLAELGGGSSLPEARSQSIPLSNDNGVPDPEKIMFDTGVRLLKATGKSEAQARTLIGKWKRDHGVPEVIMGIAEAARLGITEPVAWLEARWRTRTDKAVAGEIW